MKVVGTLSVIVDEKNKYLLLAHKKKGFGVGKWNCPGGKPEEGESLEQTAIRETEEEVGIKIELAEQVADLKFHNPDEKINLYHVIVFKALRWSGEIQETDEMKPQWFSFETIPYLNMWPDDQYWLPPVLNNQKIKGDFYFDNQKTIQTHRLEIIN